MPLSQKELFDELVRLPPSHYIEKSVDKSDVIAVYLPDPETYRKAMKLFAGNQIQSSQKMCWVTLPIDDFAEIANDMTKLGAKFRFA